MLTTFRALLKGNRLEWQDEAPEQPGGHALPVQVTLLEETSVQGEKMAAALERLAELGAFNGDDPATWERELRQERELPKRS